MTHRTTIRPPTAVQPAGRLAAGPTNLGTILHVTPRISANDNIWLRVVPEVSSVFRTVRKTVASTVNALIAQQSANARSVPVPPELLSTASDPEQGTSRILPAVPANAHELGGSELAELRTGLRQGLKKTESIPLSLEAYEQAVAMDEAKKAAQESRLSLENIRTEWAAYAAAHESNLVRMALTATALRLEGKRLIATIGSTIDRSHLQNETPRLLDALRHRLHDPALLIEVVLDEAKMAEQAAPKAQRPLTKQEKVERMKEVNPAVGELIRKFDLKIED